MLVLENVKRENNIIDADFYFPDYEEDEKYKGHVRYDISTGDYIDITYSGKERKSRYGFSHLTLALQDMVRNGHYPETYTVRWF